VGQASLAARYAPNASQPDFKAKDDEHYAEVSHSDLLCDDR
jgi:hypothetical protein